MIQLIIIGLAILSALAGASTLVTGKISVTKNAPVGGVVARNIGIGLVILAVAMAVFALVILPRLK